MTGKSLAKDMTGARVGELTVIRREGTLDRSVAWLCVCSCGTEIVAKGTELRKGSPKSCGCRKPARSPKPKPQDEGYWLLVERVGTLALIRDLKGNEVLVGWSKGWVCSSCGRARSAGETCAHVRAATLALPAATALAIVGDVVSPHAARTYPALGGEVARSPSAARREAVEALAEALSGSAGQRRQRNQQHDAQHSKATSEVTTRVMTDEDRARFEAKRAERKRKAQSIFA